MAVLFPKVCGIFIVGRKALALPGILQPGSPTRESTPQVWFRARVGGGGRKLLQIWVIEEESRDAPLSLAFPNFSSFKLPRH